MEEEGGRGCRINDLTVLRTSPQREGEAHLFFSCNIEQFSRLLSGDS